MTLSCKLCWNKPLVVNIVSSGQHWPSDNIQLHTEIFSWRNLLGKKKHQAFLWTYSFWEKITDQILFPLFVQYICISSLTQNRLGLVVFENLSQVYSFCLKMSSVEVKRVFSSALNVLQFKQIISSTELNWTQLIPWWKRIWIKKKSAPDLQTLFSWP